MNYDYVILDELEQHTYDDAPGAIVYTCPICGREYLEDFMTEDDGETMCIDCWNERHS